MGHKRIGVFYNIYPESQSLSEALEATSVSFLSPVWGYKALDNVACKSVSRICTWKTQRPVVETKISGLGGEGFVPEGWRICTRARKKSQSKFRPELPQRELQPFPVTARTRVPPPVRRAKFISGKLATARNKDSPGEPTAYSLLSFSFYAISNKPQLGLACPEPWLSSAGCSHLNWQLVNWPQFSKASFPKLNTPGLP